MIKYNSNQNLDSKRYHPTKLDLNNKNNSHSLAVDLTGKNKQVLEVGTSTGYITKILRDHGNQIIGIEIDKRAGEIARPYCDSMIIADIEELDLDNYLKISSIDVILLTDVLEHLRWPVRLLVKIKKYLKPNGYLVVSLPNVAHGDVLLNLLNGDFKYTSLGLLDYTHLRFFGRRNVVDIFSKCGYEIKNLQETKIPIGSTELKMNPQKIPPELVKFLETLPDSDVYQFVFKAIPSNDPRSEAVQDADFFRSLSISNEGIIRQHAQEISRLSEQLQHANNTANALSLEISQMKRSIVWQTTMKFHNCFVESILPQDSMQRKIYDLGLECGRILANEGSKSLWRKFEKHIKKKDTINEEYEIWIKDNEPDQLELRLQRNECKRFLYQPKISILTPVWNIDERWLRIAIESVLNQTYENWELCMVDGGSEKPLIRKILNDYSKRDRRIKVKFLPMNEGISGNSNECLSLAMGDFLVFLDHDDELAPFALYEGVKLLNSKPELDFIYSDEDKIDVTGRRMEPFFKPDWSADMFLSYNYPIHIALIRKKLIDEVKGFRKEYDGAQDYDLFLRIQEILYDKKIAHIPKILYHWRRLDTSAALSFDAKPYADIAAKRALGDAMKRRNIEIEDVSNAFSIGSYRIKYRINNNPEVSIIIPTKDNVDLLRNCINSILNKTVYSNFKIVIVDNQSSEDETFKYYNEIRNNKKIKIMEYNKVFNYSLINNFAASQTDSEYLLFLNNDTEVISNEWLTAMLEHAQKNEVGAVGAKLLFSNNTIQHCGVVFDKGDPFHIYYRRPDNPGYFGFVDIIRNYTAVTAACLLTKRSLFQKVGGFDERFAVAFNDVDYCLKLREKGYSIVYTPYARLYHHESQTRGIDDINQSRFRDERDELQKKWEAFAEIDPFLNPNLTLNDNVPSVRLTKRGTHKR